MHNYKDYRFTNNTMNTYQLRVWVEEDYLCGELRASDTPEFSYHIVEENAFFDYEDGHYYRNNEIYRRVIDRKSGKEIDRELVIKNRAKVLYDPKHIRKELLRLEENRPQLSTG